MAVTLQYLLNINHSGILLTAVWLPGVGCIVTAAKTKILAATFIYSMFFDLLVLILNAYKLLGMTSNKIGIAKMIFEDGLIFFFIAYADNHARSKWVIANSCFFRFLSNLLATIFMLLNLNEVMNIIFNIPAAVASTVGILIPLKGSNVHVDRLSTSTDCSLPGRSAAHQFYQPWPRNLV